MPRILTVEADAACPFSIAHDYAADYFQRAEDGHDEAEVRVPLPFLPLLFRKRVGLTFGVHSDGVEDGRTHDELRIIWSAGTPLLPDFHGTVRLRIQGVMTRIHIEATYHVPLGPFGRIFDALIGVHIARASLRDLAQRLAAYLLRREREWRAHLVASTN